jgi:hypothetical protein
MVSSLDQRLGARQDDSCLATFLVSAVQQFNRSSMRLGDLARKHQTDSAARRLGGVEGDEHVGGIAQPGSVVLNDENQIFLGQFPTYNDPWAPAASGQRLPV